MHDYVILMFLCLSLLLVFDKYLYQYQNALARYSGSSGGGDGTPGMSKSHENLEEEDGIQNASIHPDGDRMERLDDGELHDFIVDRVINPVTTAKEYAQNEDLPFIMWWTPFTLERGTIKRCSVGDCYFTKDQAMASHPQIKAFLFYGSGFKMNHLPLPRKTHHEWGLYHEESPKNKPIFYHHEGIALFNHTSTFKQQSSYPITTQYINSMEYLLAPSKYTTAQKDELKLSQGLASVAYIQSNCNPPSDREAYIHELMKYIDIDSYGKCLNNKKLPAKLQNSSEMLSDAFIQFLQQYKFILAFENARCDGYMTEKIFRTINVGAVPVYLGAPNIKEWLPDPNLVILVDDFESPAELAKYIKKVDNNATLYEMFLEYKKKGNQNPKLGTVLSERKWGHKFFDMYPVTGFECHVCDQIHRNRNRIKNGETPLVYQATFEHYGCPKPTRFPFPNIPGSTDWNRDCWLSDYMDGKRIAKDLYKKVFNQSLTQG